MLKNLPLEEYVSESESGSEAAVVCRHVVDVDEVAAVVDVDDPISIGESFTAMGNLCEMANFKYEVRLYLRGCNDTKTCTINVNTMCQGI